MSNTFDVTARLKGALGETLLSEHEAAVRDFFSEWCIADLETRSPEWLPETEYRTSFAVERVPHSYDVYVDGDYATWYPDVLYALRFEPVRRVQGTDDRYTVEYPIEVKTGQSSELSDNQRAVMATIEQQDDPIVPLRVRVDVGDLPESFSASPRRITHSGDAPLPEYTSNERPRSPDAVRTGPASTTLSAFRDDSRDDGAVDSLESDVPRPVAVALEVASDDRSCEFTLEDVVAALDGDVPVAVVEDALEELSSGGTVDESDDGSWKFV